MPLNDIFDNIEKLIEIWKDERRTRDVSAQLMWENVKYFTTIIGALITAHMALLGFIRDAGIPQWIFYGSLIIFPVSILLLSYYAVRDLRRRWMRVMEAIVHLVKMEGILGLYNDISNKLKNFKSDKVLFKRYKEEADKFDSSERFIESVTRGDNMYTSMRKIYYITTGISFFLVGLDLALMWFTSHL